MSKEMYTNDLIMNEDGEMTCRADWFRCKKERRQ